MSVLLSAATGRYKEIGNSIDADCVIAQSFGATENGPGRVNEQLARFIVEHAIGLPLLLQGEVAEALPEEAPNPALVIKGKPSTSSGGELDSWEVLRQCKQYMDEFGLRRPLLVAQAFHIGRVALQAEKQGMTGLIVPSDLPREFDPESIQPWTRSRGQWIRRELPGIAYLKFISHKL